MTATRARLTDRIPELLAFEAPYLEAKLLRLGVADTQAEAHVLFQEVKKYLVLAERHGEHSVPMFSSRVDEVWHQFVLFTAEYAEFCARFAGRFLHHVPDESPGSIDAEERAAELSFAQFRVEYEALFGELSAAWMDDLALTASSRLGPSAAARPLAVRFERDRAQLVHSGERPALICSVEPRAGEALRFIARERCFLVRELPGLQHDDERIALCRPLVKFGVLRLAP